MAAPPPTPAAPQLDLVHELQVELGWQPDFASSANVEYRRWLRLRAKAGDWDHVTLPPSRVVAMVWGLHRTWTCDYAAVCADAGGFLHHFPPAMRLDLAREQAYAATIHMYKTVYKQDPPASFWGPAICPYNPLTADHPLALSDPDPHPSPAPISPPPRALPSLRRAPPRRDSLHLPSPSSAAAATATTVSPTSQRKEKPASDPTPRRSSYPTRNALDEPSRLVEKPRSSPADHNKLPRRASKAWKDINHSPSESLDHIEDVPIDASPRATKTKTKRRMIVAGPEYVLKPLGPGEKRKRGRPSFSDYVLAEDASKPSSAEPKKEPKSSGPLTTKPDRAVPVTIRRRRSVATAPKAPTGAQTISKKDKSTQSKSLRRVGRAAAVIAAAVGSKAAAPSSPAAPSKPSVSPEQTVNVAKEGPVVVKRPRGRPRKDGSWPIARPRPSETSVKQSAPEAPKTSREDAASPAEEKQEVEQHHQKSAQGNKEPVAEKPVPTEKPKGPQPMEGIEIANAGSSATPSKIIKGGDVQMEDLTVKAAKPGESGANVKGAIPCSQGMGGNGIGEKSVVGSAPGVSKETAASDPVFPLSSSSRNPSGNNLHMDVPLGSLGRQNATAIPTSGSGAGSTGLQAPNMVPSGLGFPTASIKAVPIAPALGVSGVPTVTAMSSMPAMPSMPLSSSSVPHLSAGNSVADAGMMPMDVVGEQPKLGHGIEIEGPDTVQDEEDSKKPFRRPRVRQRRDSQWPGTRKPVSDEAVERVKDLNEPAPQLNFPMGPSGSV